MSVASEAVVTVDPDTSKHDLLVHPSLDMFKRVFAQVRPDRFTFKAK